MRLEGVRLDANGYHDHCIITFDGAKWFIYGMDVRRRHMFLVNAVGWCTMDYSKADWEAYALTAAEAIDRGDQ